MKRVLYSVAVCLIISGLAAESRALSPIESKNFSVYPITNEVSFYKNVDDGGVSRGWTLQVISINNFKLVSDFNFEFTGDFNWDMSYQNYDYYIELSLVKAVGRGFSVNYQRIESAFEDRGINQFGLRFSF
ncbi:MAG: hypothetical protein JSV44_09545 [Candidatus Zixiibacteriota bacterium]|nr:MAG: hypothetical protein JSV44_09545 [candidate division Zixibacteria bacterium]